MAVAPFRKARSEPRPPKAAPNGACSAAPVHSGMAVLLTKQDFENLRTHALSPSRDLPRCLPTAVVVPTATGAVGSSGSASSAGTAAPRRVTPKVERRVRSATGSRPPQVPVVAYGSQGAAASSSSAEPSGTAAARKQAKSVNERVVSMDVFPRQEPVRRQTPTRRQQRHSAGPAPSGAVPSIGGTATRSASSGPSAVASGASAAANSTSVQGGQGSVGVVNARAAGPSLGVCGFDPRRPPRPDNSIVSRATGKDQDRLVLIQPLQANMLGLQVSGLAAPVVTASQTAEATDAANSGSPDLKVEEWSSSEEEEGTQTDAPEDTDGSVFDYREYRYLRYQEARSRAAPVEPQRRGAKFRRAYVAQPSVQVRDESCDSGCSSPWADSETPSLRCLPDARLPSADFSVVVASASRGSTPCCEEEPPDDELRRVGEVLVKFYGLPGGIDRTLRFKHNIVIVSDEAWAAKERHSQLDEPPMLWVRGGRVYDFHGDRGTLAEFTHDLLWRQVEDDAICRQRRRDQGLMPYPFLALPLKRDDDADEAEPGVAGPGGRNAGSDGRDGRRRHWV